MKSRRRLMDVLQSYRRFWIICGGLFVANVLFYLFFVASQSDETTRLQSRFQSERQQVSEQRKRQAAIEQYQTLQASWQDFEANLPGKTQFPERIQRLKQVLNRHRLSMEDMAFRSEALDDTNLVRFTTTFQTKGPYDAVKSFIAELQAMEGLFCIHELALRKTEPETPLEMRMQLSAYFRNDNTAAQP